MDSLSAGRRSDRCCGDASNLRRLGQPLLDERFPLSLIDPFTSLDAGRCGMHSSELSWLCTEGFQPESVSAANVAQFGAAAADFDVFDLLA